MSDHTARLWPAAADAGYVLARTELLQAEQELRDATERVAALRRKLPQGAELPAYTFTEGPADLAADLAADGPVTRPALADLFGGHDTLVVYHMMYAPEDDQACPMCSMWLDGLHGVGAHIQRRAGFVVVAKAPVAKLRAWARTRGWTGLRLVSSHGTTFNADLGVEGPDELQEPAISVLVRDGAAVRHFYTQQALFPSDGSERGLDPYCPVWQVFDLLPNGRGDFYATNDSTDHSTDDSTDDAGNRCH